MFICRHSDCFVYISFQNILADIGKIVPTNEIGAPSGAGVFVQLKRLQVLSKAKAIFYNEDMFYLDNTEF